MAGMEAAGGRSDLDVLLAEQLAYYRVRAPEYTETAIPELPAGELTAAEQGFQVALDGLGPCGEVLELACGPGTWTSQLLRHAEAVTALDGAPEMLQLAARRVTSKRVRFVQADILYWEPDRRYDVVFFGFWLSHVPLERFDDFWKLVDQCLKPGGRVAFADDAYRSARELVGGEGDSIIRRELTDGRSFRVIKVPHTPGALQARLLELGWAVSVRYIAGPFFWGIGTRAIDSSDTSRPGGRRDAR